MPLAQDSVLALGLWSLGLSALWPAALSEQSGEDRFGDGRLVLTHAGSIIPSTGIAGITPVDGIIISHKADRSRASGISLPMYYDSQGGQHCGRQAACTGIAPQPIQITADRSGLNAFASIGRSGFVSDEPSKTGGGSVGATLRR